MTEEEGKYVIVDVFLLNKKKKTKKGMTLKKKTTKKATLQFSGRAQLSGLYSVHIRCLTSTISRKLHKLIKGSCVCIHRSLNVCLVKLAKNRSMQSSKAETGLT